VHYFKIKNLLFNNCLFPKIVNTYVGPNYNWKEKVVSRYAPFATNDTPETKVKIIGGRLVIVENNNNNS